MKKIIKTSQIAISLSMASILGLAAISYPNDGVAEEAKAETSVSVSESFREAAGPVNEPTTPTTTEVVEDPKANSPQILNLPPKAGLTPNFEVVNKFNEERKEEDRLARLPKAVAPTSGVITTGFEMRWGSFHDGLDIANALGTPIYAVEDGVVINSGPVSGYGNWIKIRHNDGTVTLYGHMETLDVSVGDKVVAGQKIAGMGSRGFSTGSHLHFTVISGGAPINPVSWLHQKGVTI